MFSSINRFSRLVKFVPNARNFCPKKCGFKSFLYIDKNVLNATVTRSLWFLCDNRTVNPLGSVTVAHPWTSKCTCGCNFHTEGDEELVAYLDEELNNERKAHKSFKVPALAKFESKLDGSEIVLTRKFHNEVITVKLNINHSADSEGMVLGDAEDKSKEPAVSEFKSKPNFTVEIEKNGKILSFHCCYSEAVLEDSDDTYSDAFHIAELAFYEGDWKDSVYSVYTEIMDGNLYDLLKDLLEERGITNDFAHQLTEFCTSYEHKLYIGLLEKMKKLFSEI